MYYIVYKTTNMINGKIYIGVHKSNELEDQYLGSGYSLKRAIQKYGKVSFVRENLFVYDNASDMYTKEIELVNEEFVNRADTYNLTIGGRGSFGHLSSEELLEAAKRGREITNQKLLEKYGEDWRKILSERGRNSRLLAISTWRAENPEKSNINLGQGKFAALSKEAKQKRKETMKQKGHSQGDKNSQFGTMWINNSVENKKIKNNEIIPEGWNKGRI